MLALCLPPVRGQEEEEGTKKNKIEAASPDGRFAFRYSGDPDKAGADDAESQTYDLIDKKSGRVLMSVVESDNDIGPSARFSMHVLWQADSKAFAITAFLWKRGSTLFVYKRDGSTFRKIEIPELEADIPEKEMKGKEFPHVVESSSETAKRWQKTDRFWSRSRAYPGRRGVCDYGESQGGSRFR